MRSCVFCRKSSSGVRHIRHCKHFPSHVPLHVRLEFWFLSVHLPTDVALLVLGYHKLPWEFNQEWLRAHARLTLRLSDLGNRLFPIYGSSQMSFLHNVWRFWSNEKQFLQRFHNHGFLGLGYSPMSRTTFRLMATCDLVEVRAVLVDLLEFIDQQRDICRHRDLDPGFKQLGKILRRYLRPARPV